MKTFVFVFIRKLDPLPFFAHFVLSMKKFLLVLCKDSKTLYIVHCRHCYVFFLIAQQFTMLRSCRRDIFPD